MRSALLLAVLALQVGPLPALDDLDPSQYSPLAVPSVPPGFRATLFAQEPHIRNPASLAFDDRGRLFVGQGPQFRHPKEETPGDEIVLVEDIDEDGLADSFKTFAYGFNSIQGLAWKGCDLWVANAPDLTVVRDLDGDDVADEYRLIYSGLGTLEHALHGLNWGPDGMLYLSKGDTPVLPDAPKPFRDLTHVPSGAPDTQPIRTFNPPGAAENPYRKTYIVPTDPHTEGGILRCDEAGENLEIVARGMRNPYDICFDDEFNWIGTDNDQDGGDRILMPFYGAHFGHRHPWSYHWSGEDHPPTVPVSGPMFHGSGTGVVYHSGSRFPDPYRNVFFIGDWLNLKVYVYRPRWEGALLQSRDDELEVFAESGSDRSLFRPTDLAVGADGALFVSSWGFEYGAKWDETNRQTNAGRIYKIEPTQSPDSNRLKDGPERTPLSEQSLEEIVDDLDQDVLARTVSAQDELVRRGKEVRSSIEAALRSNDLSKGQRTWLAWALGRISMEDSSIDRFFIGRLKDESSPLDIRVQSLRILAHRVRFNDSGRALPDEVVRFLNDENPRLRFEAVQALWRSRCSDKSEPLLEALAKEEDRLVYYALWGALRDLLSIQDRKQILTTHPSSAVRFGMLLGLLENGELEGEEVVQILQSDEDARIQTWASAWLAQVGHGLEEPGQVIQKLLELNRRGINYELRMNLLASLERMEVSGQDWTDLYEGFYANHRKGEIYVPEKSQEAALCLRVLSRDERSLPILWEALSHEWAPVRRAAIESFRNLGEKGRDFLLTRFDAIEDPQLRGAIEALSRFDHRNEPWLGSDKQVERIVEACSRSDDPLFRQKALQLLVMAAPETWKRPASKSYAVSLVHGAMNDPDPRIYLLGENLAKIVGEEVHAVRREPATLEGVLAKIETANLDNGKRLFFQEGGRAACYRCHRVGALGNNFAPDLTDIGGRLDRRKLAESILDPNAEITEGYRARLLETLDGEVLTGVILRETETFLDLAQSDGETARIEKGDIVEQRNLETSIMPSNYAELLSSQELADIAAWLMSATPEPEKR